MEEITTLISTVGFPIAISVYLLIQQERMNANHKEEINALTKQLEANTLTLQKLIDKLDTIDGEE